MHLPDAAWTRREDLARLVVALGAGQARYVGGAVRDTLLGLPVSDIDIATPLWPGAVTARLSEAGIRTVPTGIDHGTVTAVIAGGAVEITTLRRDVSTDGRRATVAFSDDWREDAARRDFTINALYADPAGGEIFDWFGGIDDLTHRRVRFIGDARERIREDHLRVLRYFRFQARFGSQDIDLASESACAELAPMLKGLSRERIGMETIKLLALPDPAPTIARMAELGVLAVILPEGDPAPLAALVAEERRQAVTPDPVRRLAALLPPDPALAEQVAARFRLSGTQRKRLVCAAGRAQSPSPSEKGLGWGLSSSRLAAPGREPPPPAPSPEGEGAHARALAYRIGRTEAVDRLLLARSDTAPLADWPIPRLPLKGGEIVARGVGAGPEVARILQQVEARWIAEGFPDRQRVLALLDEELRS